MPNHNSACVCFSAGRKQPGVVLRPGWGLGESVPSRKVQEPTKPTKPTISTLDGDWRRAADRGYFWCFGGETTYTAVGRRPLLTKRARFDVFFVDLRSTTLWPLFLDALRLGLGEGKNGIRMVRAGVCFRQKERKRAKLKDDDNTPPTTWRNEARAGDRSGPSCGRLLLPMVSFCSCFISSLLFSF